MTFQEVEDRFKHKLQEFADGGYRFNNDYTLYKQSQQEGFQGYLDGLSKREKHGYIELPTGVGKTALFISLIKNYLDAANGEENAPRVLIAVPTEKLAVQTAQAFAKFMPDIAKTLEADGDKGQEIDWQKSDIGLQYGKMKHAHKKPKVLITTYQSLARDTANKTYPPEDFGFVIYDEGHVITGPTFGKAVDKFHDSIQLAVTATPEYTETKTVASRLPHRYFQLPLAEAINRGDLCNVRPAIIKTGYKLDEAMFQKFMDQQGSTPLNSHQLQQLLNQEARNKAVVETYMRGADPDSGERYFGQNGMIFCTGIKHADAIAAQFTKAMGQGEGIKLQNWLDGENVELIASVHGNAQGQWLKKGLMPDAPTDTRKYQGNREWYSEQEIFDLHEKGKILLLVSVAKLKAGYDSPRDSLLFDLADRFSKVDATQIDGRAFRLDPENPNKTATVFNLMDKNTQELYDKFPKMIPIYCAEVIEGAEFRPPARRTGAQIRFKEPPPGMETSLKQAGFDIVTNIDAVRTISRNNKAKREKAFIPPAPDGWKSITTLTTELGSGYHTISNQLEAIRATKLAEGISGDDIQREWMGNYTNTDGKAVFHVSPHVIELISSKQTPSVPNGWKSVNTLATELDIDKATIRKGLEAVRAAKLAEGISEIEIQRDWVGHYSYNAANRKATALHASPRVMELIGFKKALPAPQGWKTANILSTELGGSSTGYINQLEAVRATKLAEGMPADEIQREWVGNYTNSTGTICLHASSQAIELMRSQKAPPPPEGWKTAKMLATELGGSSTVISKRLEAIHATKLAEGISEDEIQREWMRICTKSGGRPFLHASPQAIELMLSQQAPPAPEGWKTARMFATELGNDISTTTKRLEAIRTTKLAEGISEDEIQREWMGNYTSNSGKSSLHISPQTMQELIDQRENTGKVSFVAKVGQKRSISPGSDHLKRTGRTLGKNGEN